MTKPRLDATLYHDPTKASALVTQAIKASGSQSKLAARAGVTPRYLQLLEGEKPERDISYALQVLLERIIAEGDVENKKIDASLYHDVSKVADLIVPATKVAGTQKNLAARAGVTPRYLQIIKSGKNPYKASYALQVFLETLIEVGK